MEEYYVLVYSNRKGTYARPEEAGKLVGIDSNSGGYPYPTTHPARVHYWDKSRLRDVLYYKKCFDFLDIYVVNFGITKYEVEKEKA